MTHPMPTTPKECMEVVAAFLKYMSNLLSGFHLEGLPLVLGNPCSQLPAGNRCTLKLGNLRRV